MYLRLGFSRTFGEHICRISSLQRLSLSEIRPLDGFILGGLLNDDLGVGLPVPVEGVVHILDFPLNGLVGNILIFFKVQDVGGFEVIGLVKLQILVVQFPYGFQGQFLQDQVPGTFLLWLLSGFLLDQLGLISVVIAVVVVGRRVLRQIGVGSSHLV